jgi:hypothetical protein
MGHGTCPLHIIYLHDDGLGLALPNPDRKHTITTLFLEDEHVGVGSGIKPES